MAVKLELYRVFKEVAETGNISAAAKNLYISQSAVSQSIKQLETALQARLFARSPRGVTLTGEGRMLYQYVRNALGLLATGDAWGEWDAEGAATAVQEAGDDSLQASVGLDTPTFADALPTGDYLQAYSEEQGLGFAGQAAMYILSGVIGVAVLTITFRLVSLTVKESGAHGNSRAA